MSSNQGSHVSDWQPIELELVKDGHLARVRREGKRWRWHVVPMEVVLKWGTNHRNVDKADALGWCGTPERAMEVAREAIKALCVARRGKRSA